MSRQRRAGCHGSIRDLCRQFSRDDQARHEERKKDCQEYVEQNLGYVCGAFRDTRESKRCRHHGNHKEYGRPLQKHTHLQRHFSLNGNRRMLTWYSTRNVRLLGEPLEHLTHAQVCQKRRGHHDQEGNQAFFGRGLFKSCA